jgi:ABC-type multidrug transport system fused ATPase/permease subunit
MKNDPFWRSAKILLRYRKDIGLASLGALISAASFGAGLTLMLPVISLMFGSKEQGSHGARQLIEDYLAKHDGSNPATAIAHWKISALTTLHDVLPVSPFHSFLCIVAVIALLTVIGSLGRYLHELTTVTLVYKASQYWRQQMFNRIIHAPMGTVQRAGSSDYISRLITDSNTLATGYRAILGKALGEILKGAAGLIAAFFIDWRIALAACVGVPFIAILLRKFSKKIRRASKEALVMYARLIATIKESVGGISVVKVHGAEGYERRRFARRNRELVERQMKIRRTKALASPLVDTLGLFGVMGLACVAAYMIFEKGLEPENFITVLVCLGAAASCLKPLSQLNSEIGEAGAAAQRIYEVVEAPVEPTGKDRPALPVLARHSKEISFQDVVFRYPGADRNAVDGLTLTVPFGKTVAIVGPNGSGKSTLINMVVRLIEPTAGKVVIDGQDITSVDMRSLRAQAAVVTQQSVLFEGSIALNISYGELVPDRTRTIEAAKAGYADEFISVLPEGYEAKLGEDGVGLSGGQKQRICIARAILRDPAILILDEATSQIDADSEAKITAALRTFRQGRTVFVIAHRLSTVVDADLIVVMDQGKIVAQGTHSELMGESPLYQKLAKSQLFSAE